VLDYLRPDGRAMVIEYDRATPNTWVPYDDRQRRATGLDSLGV
jgi:hypothetical protein